MRYLVGLLGGLIVLSTGPFSLASKEGEKVKQKAAETAEATKEFAIEKRRKFEAGLKRELTELNLKIKELRAKASEKGQDAKQEMDSQLQKLESKKRDVTKELDKLSMSTGKAWDRLKEGVEAAWLDLKKAYSEAAGSFNE